MTYGVFDDFNTFDVVSATPHSVVDNFNVDLIFANLPSAPSNLTAEPLDTGALLTWTPAVANGSVIIGYTVIATQLGGGSLHYTIAPDATGATIAGLANDETWSIQLYAFSAYGRGDFANPVTVSPTAADPGFDPGGSGVYFPDESLPDAPVLDDLIATEGAAGAYWIAPTFTGGTDILWYDIEAVSGVDGASVRVRGDIVAALVGPLTNGEEYTVTVKAVNIVGSSPASNALTVTPQEGLPPLNDLPGFAPPPEPPPYREPEPVYLAFVPQGYFTPSNWLLAAAGGE
jgi:large repetitive protein